jgi:polysaccharide export outer membrane protein
MRRRELGALLVMAVASLGGCGSTGNYVWVTALPPTEVSAAHGAEYVIVEGDVLAVRVVGQDSASATTRVRSDGRITLPLIGDVMARGHTPTTLSRDIETRLKPFIVVPSVSVAVQETQAAKVSIVGEVTHPGVYMLGDDAHLLAALALAGGPTDFASSDKIFVLRATAAAPLRIRFTWRRLTHGDLPDSQFTLRGGDTVVVE